MLRENSTHYIAPQYGYYVISHFLLSFLVLIIMVRLTVLALLLLEGPVVTVGRENIVTISASHEDLNNRSVNETVCSE